MTLFDGTNLNNFNAVGTANWKVGDGMVEATSGQWISGLKDSYSNLSSEWSSGSTRAGTAASTCVVRTRPRFRTRPATRQMFSTSVRTSGTDRRDRPRRQTAGDRRRRWEMEHAEITAKGPQLTVKLNGTLTAQAEDAKLASGPIALQYAAGTVRFRRGIRFGGSDRSRTLRSAARWRNPVSYVT